MSFVIEWNACAEVRGPQSYIIIFLIIIILISLCSLRERS